MFFFSSSAIALLFAFASTLGSVSVNAISISIRAPEQASPSLSNSTSVVLSQRDVWCPQITSPKAGMVWRRGSHVRITWLTNNKPTRVTNHKGEIVLGYCEENSPNEHLSFEHVLASGFDLSSAGIEVQVPMDVPPGKDYIVILFGDSGNRSPMFSII